MHIALGIAKIDRDAREPESVCLIGQNHAAVGVRLLLRMVVKGISPVAISD
jgi:hypothetical protein